MEVSAPSNVLKGDEHTVKVYFFRLHEASRRRVNKTIQCAQVREYELVSEDF